MSSTIAPIALAAALAGAVLVSNEWSHRSALQSQSSTAGRYRARIATEWLLRRLVDAETAQRGYLLTDRAQYLEPYRNAEGDVLRALAEVRAQHARDPATLAALEEVTRHARGRLSELVTTLAMHDAGDHLGWRKLRHRIESLGGRMLMVSAPGRGTEIEARLPLGASMP